MIVSVINRIKEHILKVVGLEGRDMAIVLSLWLGGFPFGIVTHCFVHLALGGIPYFIH